jgi:flagellin FlaB
MWKLFMKKGKGQKGITGLETAIILIAFVIVASVFAYVVLSAGLYSSQKAKEAITSGLGSTMAVLELKGDVIVEMNGGNITDVEITVGLPAAGSPVDFGTTQNGSRMVVITYVDDQIVIPSCNWTLTKLNATSDNDLLQPNELYQIDIDLSSAGNIIVNPYHTFTIEVKPPDGPVLSIERTIPARVSEFVNLH